MAKSHRIPGTHCVFCEVEITAADSLVDPDLKPHPGALTLCIECGGLMIFDDNMQARLLKKADVERLMSSAELVHELVIQQQAIWMLRGHRPNVRRVDHLVDWLP